MAVKSRRVWWINRIWIVLSFCLVLGLSWKVRAHEGVSMSGPTCNDEYLIAVENATEGIIVNVLNKRNSVVQYQKFEGRYLSSQCGDHSFRCKDLLVVSSSSTVMNKTIIQHIVFIPLLDGVLLLEYSYNGVSLSSTDDYFIEISIGCSPTAIFEIFGNIYAVCLSQEAKSLTVLRVYLDSSSISDSRVGPPLIDFNGLANPPRLSDFKFVDLSTDDPNFQWIIFASSNYLFSFIPLSYSNQYLGFLDNCSLPESLVYVPDDVLLIYCQDDSAIYFNLLYGQTINQTQYSEHGQPFLCPDPDVHIAVFASASYIQYSRWSDNSRENFNIYDIKFDSGVCFSFNEDTLFAYNDKEKGVYILDTNTSNLQHVSSKACLNSQCEPLMDFQNRYIVIREQEQYDDANVIVVDLKENYTVINAKHVKAHLLSLLIEEGSTYCPEHALSPSTPAVTVPSFQKKSVLQRAVGGGIGGLVAVIVCFILVAFVWKKRQRKERHPTQATEETANLNGNIEFQDGDNDSSQQVDDSDQVLMEEGRNNSSAVVLDGSHGDPSFKQLPQPNQVYPSVKMTSVLRGSHDQPLLETAEDQKNNLHTQGNSDTNQHSAVAPSGGVTSRERLERSGVAAATSLDRVSGSQQAGACASVAHSNGISSEAPSKPNERYSLCALSDTSLLSSSSESCRGEGEWVTSTEPKCEESRAREYDPGDELIHGKSKAIPQCKSLHATGRKMKKKRAEKGNYENYDYQNLEEQIVQEELTKV